MTRPVVRRLAVSPPLRRADPSIAAMNLRRLAASSIAFTLAACGDSTGPTSASGSMSFNFSGSAVGSGTFSAVGVPPASDTATPSKPFTAALLDDASSGTLLMAYLPGVPQTRFAFVGASGRVPGAFPVDSTCHIGACTLIGVEFGGEPFGDGLADFSCIVTVGTVTISTISSKRTSGTFSGTGTCRTPAGAVSTFAVSNGAFDAPFVTVF